MIPLGPGSRFFAMIQEDFGSEYELISLRKD